MEAKQCPTRPSPYTTELDFYFSEKMVEMNKAHNQIDPIPICGYAFTEHGSVPLRYKEQKRLINGQPYTYCVNKGSVPKCGWDDLVFVGSGTFSDTTTDGVW